MQSKIVSAAHSLDDRSLGASGSLIHAVKISSGDLGLCVLTSVGMGEIVGALSMGVQVWLVRLFGSRRTYEIIR